MYEWRVIYPTGVTAGRTVKSGTAANGPTITYVTNGLSGSYRVEARAVRAGCTASNWVSSPVLATARIISLGITPIYDEYNNYVGDLLAASSIAGATYQWTASVNGGTPQTLAGETGPTMDVTAHQGVTTQYCVTVALNGCTTNTVCASSDFSHTAAARVGSGDADTETLNRRVLVYPNPTADGEFALKLPAFREPAGVVLRNARGQVVYRGEVNKEKSKLSAGKLGSGVYLLQVALDGRVVTKKIVVEK